MPGWERPDNARPLAYIATWFGKEKRFVANAIDALAIAALRRTGMSKSRRVLREARDLEGVTVVPSDLRGAWEPMTVLVERALTQSIDGYRQMCHEEWQEAVARGLSPTNWATVGSPKMRGANSHQ